MARRPKKAQQEDPLAGIKGAVILLLGDLNGNDLYEVLLEICHSKGLAISSVPVNTIAHIRQALVSADELCANLDGSSGIGAIAAKNIGADARNIRANLQNIAVGLGLKTK